MLKAMPGSDCVPRLSNRLQKSTCRDFLCLIIVLGHSQPLLSSLGMSLDFFLVHLGYCLKHVLTLFSVCRGILTEILRGKMAAIRRE